MSDFATKKPKIHSLLSEQIKLNPLQFVQGLRRKYSFGLPASCHYRRLVAEHLGAKLNAKFDVPQEFVAAYKKVCGRK
ncbi:MAG TPA: hypothetical protein VJW95_04155 [Dissulfurispiraceae bacterium]|nr:hypothetical protein [Dissulfurispiraceae bacterium]